MVQFQGLFLKKWILWKSSILKRFIFVVPEYDNLTSVKTHRDRLENSREGMRSSNFGFGKDERPHRGFGCYSVVALSFFCLFYPWVFKNFLISALDCPFSGFHPRVIFSFHSRSFSFFIFFWLSYYALDNSKFIPNKWKILRFFCWLRKETTAFREKFLKKENSSVQISTFNRNGLFRYVM